MNMAEINTFTLDELAEKYPRQWLAVTVVQRNNDGQPLKVNVLTHEIDVFTARNKAGTHDFCTIYTGPIPEVNHLGMF
jgi:hypothetical protein